MKLNVNAEIAHLDQLENAYSIFASLREANVNAGINANAALGMEQLRPAIKHAKALLHKAKQCKGK